MLLVFAKFSNQNMLAAAFAAELFAVCSVVYKMMISTDIQLITDD